MTQHTPGPWRVDPDHCRDVQTADGAIEICLAEGGEPYGKNLFSVPSMEEAHANARLIAAAPDMLDELKNLRRAYVNLLESGRDRIVFLGGQCDPILTMVENDPHLKSSEAVIAKATGETK